MLTRNRQRKYLRLRWDNVLIHLDRFARRTNANDVHEVRVELKKIRALLFLHELVHGSFRKNLVRPGRRLFKQAGRVRDAQVTAHLVRQYKGIPAVFFGKQRQVVASEAKRLAEMVNTQTDALVLSNIKIWKRLKRIHYRDVNKAVKKLQRNINSYFRPKLILSNLHNSRKEIKRLIYICNLITPEDFSRLNIDLEKYKLLEETIGKWHDVELTKQVIAAQTPGHQSVLRRLRRDSAMQIRQIRKIVPAINRAT